MLKALSARLVQGSHEAGPLPERFRGRPDFAPEVCPGGCRACADACPTGAIQPGSRLDLGACLFCGECTGVCPTGAVEFRPEPAMAVRAREDLVLEGQELRLAEALDRETRRLFGRSLRLRQVSAAGCNGCEAEVAALNNVVFDLSRYGIGFVASPRHADGLLITGAVSANMREALLKTYEAVSPPRLVIAVGACALTGGPYFETCPGIADLVPVDLMVPGCPPHPLTILDGLLRLLGRRSQAAPAPHPESQNPEGF